MTAIIETEPDRSDPREAVLALVQEALRLADEHGLGRAAIYLDQARVALNSEVGQPTRV